MTNAMEIFKKLPKTNCRKCNETTCLAFASKVFLGTKKIEQCPYVSQETIDLFREQSSTESLTEKHQKEWIADVKKKISRCDLKAAAARTGGRFENNRLQLRIFGKPFYIDDKGNVYSDIHINHWITSNVLGYILECKGVPLTNKWVPFRELSGGREKNGLFVKRSQESFKQIADNYTGLFEDLIHIFNGQNVETEFDSDISLILEPLPKLPILVCYWKPADGLSSELNLFFDSSADLNASIDIVYGIAAGIVVMFEKIALRHGTAQ